MEKNIFYTFFLYISIPYNACLQIDNLRISRWSNQMSVQMNNISQWTIYTAGLILGLRPASERRCYFGSDNGLSPIRYQVII